eukprot:gene671-1292_t
MLSAIIFYARSYSTLLLIKQPIHQRCTKPGPLVLRFNLLNFLFAADRDRTVSRRSKPSSRTTLIGEQPNPWNLLQLRDVMSRHRGLSETISLLSPAYLLFVERWLFRAKPPDHYDRLSSLFDMFILQLSNYISLHEATAPVKLPLISCLKKLSIIKNYAWYFTNALAPTPHLHGHFNFTKLVLETAEKSLHHSCRSELTRQGISLPLDRQSYSRRLLGINFYASAYSHHLTAPGRSPLIPKLQGQFAEFLQHNYLEHLSIFYPSTCVGLRHEFGPPISVTT